MTQSRPLQVELTPSRADIIALEQRTQSTTSATSSADERRRARLTRSDAIDTLVVATKAHQTLEGLARLRHRLSGASTVVLCQNGMGALEHIIDRFWPDDRGIRGDERHGRPNFIAASTTHGAWRKGPAHFVHAGRGAIQFAVLPNAATAHALERETDSDSPLVDLRSMTEPSSEHLPPVTRGAETLHTTVRALLDSNELNARWLPAPQLECVQLQKLAANCAINCLTAIMGVHNGAIVGSQNAARIIDAVASECAAVFAAHVARRHGLETVALPSSHMLSAPSLATYINQVALRTGPNLSSTLQDVLATPSPPFAPSPHAPTRTELDYINGYVEALGERHGVRTPVTSAIGSLAKMREEMTRSGAIDRVAQVAGERVTARKRPTRRMTGTSPPDPNASAAKARSGTRQLTPGHERAKAQEQQRLERELDRAEARAERHEHTLDRRRS